jgi:hypothetical protein
LQYYTPFLGQVCISGSALCLTFFDDFVEFMGPSMQPTGKSEPETAGCEREENHSKKPPSARAAALALQPDASASQ